MDDEVGTNLDVYNRLLRQAAQREIETRRELRLERRRRMYHLNELLCEAVIVLGVIGSGTGAVLGAVLREQEWFGTAVVCLILILGAILGLSLVNEVD